MKFQEIEHPGGVTELIFSPRWPYIGVAFSPTTGFPNLFYGNTQRKYTLLLAGSGLTYSPKVRSHEPTDGGYLVLTNTFGERATVTTNCLADFRAALHQLRELR